MGFRPIKTSAECCWTEFLVAVLAESRPDELREAYDEAVGRGPNWRRRIEASLKRLPDAAKRLEEVRG